jgi:putative transposase
LDHRPDRRAEALPSTDPARRPSRLHSPASGAAGPAGLGQEFNNDPKGQRPDHLPAGILNMSQSLAQVWLHVVFSTKERRPFLQNEEFRTEMFRMLSHHVKETKCVNACVGEYIDLVHLLIGLARTNTIAKLVERVKSETSKWAKTANNGRSTFPWQAGFGAFSVSHSLRNNVDAYIRNQAEHHTTSSYQDEFRRLCEKHGLEIDERYVWD